MPKLMAAVKEIPGHKFDWTNKFWRVPIDQKEEVEKMAKKFNLTYGNVAKTERTDFVIDPLPELTIDIPVKRPLFPFQRNGVAYAMWKRRLIIGDDMGLGKSSQAIVSIAGLNHIGVDALPLLIICPSSVKINWCREVTLNTNLKPIVLSDTIKNNFIEFYRVGVANVFIVNYESLKKYFVDHIDDPGQDPETGRKKPLRINHIHFKQKQIGFFKSVIADESHRLKAFKTLATKFTKGICTGKEIIMLLTGTPVINKPRDLVSQLGIIDRLNDFGGYNHFDRRYCAGLKDASNLSELNYMLNKHCFYRRNKKDPNIQLQLPDKMRQIITCELSAHARHEYDIAMADLKNYMSSYRDASDEQIKKSMAGEALFRIGVLKNISARGKLADVFDFVQDVIDSGEKIVLFANLKEVISKVVERFPKAVKVTGDENDLQKQAAVDKFQRDPDTNVFIGNLKAAGVGITLTESNKVAFIEQGWHAAIMDQAEDRCFRIGQKNNVMCSYFIGKDTIDEWNYDLIQQKREMANRITGNEDDFETSIIDSVMSLLK
jgi:SWI/SNF-related matrix-associated actin-dependent regulator 1 of chromatin subfamily A